jgi:uncharacterized protein YbjT (DUF2867 family)
MGERTVPRIRALVRNRAKAAKLGPNAELVARDLDDPASLKPAFANVDEAFVVVNGKDLNRLEANALRSITCFQAASASVASTRARCCGRCKSVYSWKTE